MNDVSNCRMELYSIDRAILDALQRGLPVTERPFALIARDLGMPERQVVARTADLKRAGYIRRLGAFFPPGGWAIGEPSSPCPWKRTGWRRRPTLSTGFPA